MADGVHMTDILSMAVDILVVVGELGVPVVVGVPGVGGCTHLSG